MACDRPLDKLAAHSLPAIPAKRMPAQVQMEYIPAHGVVSADGTELKTHRDLGKLLPAQKLMTPMHIKSLSQLIRPGQTAFDNS